MTVGINRGRKVKSFATSVALLLMIGCGGNLTQSNYDKVQTGMTQEDVEKILGKGKEQASSSMDLPGVSAGTVSIPGSSMSMKVLTWQDGSKVISLSFQNGKLVSKAQSGL